MLIGGKHLFVVTQPGFVVFSDNNAMALRCFTYVGMTADIIEISDDSAPTRGERTTRRSLYRISLEKHKAEVTSVAFSQKGAKLASGSNDGTIMIWGLTDTK